MDKITQILHDTGIIPVVKIEDAAEAVPMARALLRGGLPAAEITFRTDAAAESIRKISQEVPEVFVCAGTVLTTEQAVLAVENGAKAIISPGMNPLVVAKCKELHVPIFPGCATPTEIEGAIALGLTVVKLFPAEVVGGISMLKALSGPYAAMRFMPTGGISLKNVQSYLELPNVIACGGSWICPEALLKLGDFEGIEEIAREAAALVRTIRMN
ncbi:MAG: bifunctional 4-hydroxy-2-oxoglutarate aldolase/2-dehydro-3-deoxy-phosphogluconate aldolase [Oscillospiraceae bacterium]